jgi:hypothetical protein
LWIGSIVFKIVENLALSLKNVHYLGTINTHLLAQQLFPPLQWLIAFTLSSNFKAFLFTDVDDFDMMHNARFSTILKTMLPVQHRITFVYYISLFVCFIQIISYWDNFINNKCKQEEHYDRNKITSKTLLIKT